MSKTLIIPGLDASPAPHWQHWWAVSDPSAILVDLPDPAAPQTEAWEDELAGMILRHPDAILVAHSLGAVLSTRVLVKFPQLRVKAALLVAPASPDVDARIASFGPLHSCPLGVPATLVASRNDPWMSFSQAKAKARDWGAEVVDLGFAGHVNVASGFGPWPQGKLLRDQLLARTTPLGAGLPLGVRPVASGLALRG